MQSKHDETQLYGPCWTSPDTEGHIRITDRMARALYQQISQLRTLAGNETQLKGPNPELAIRPDSPLRKEKMRDKSHLPNKQFINLIRIQEGPPRRASPAPQRGICSAILEILKNCCAAARELESDIF